MSDTAIKPAPALEGFHPTEINRERLQQLDAEIAEREAARHHAEDSKRAGQEEEPEPIRAPEQDPAIVAALEPIRERAARLSPVKRRMVESSVQIAADAPDDVVFQHSVFCQTVLPYRDPGPDVRTWGRRQGRVDLLLEAGHLREPEGGFKPVGLPFGIYARRALLYLNTEALRTRDRTIDVDGGVTAFTRRILGRAPNGREIHHSKDALARLSACNVIIAYDDGDRAIQVNARVVTAFDLWEERHETERCVTPRTVMLSADYFENLLTHAVPLDERAIAALAHSAMGLDVYAWLAQRLHRVDRQSGQFVPWTALHAQFGQVYKNIRQFRADFKTALNQVLTQYPEARIKIDRGGLLLANSPPPVAARRLTLLPPAKTLKG